MKKEQAGGGAGVAGIARASPRSGASLSPARASGKSKKKANSDTSTSRSSSKSRSNWKKAKREDDWYEVESIEEKKLIAGKPHYLIKWQGYDTSENTWESENALNCTQLLATFNKKFQDSTRGTNKSPNKSDGGSNRSNLGSGENLGADSKVTGTNAYDNNTVCNDNINTADANSNKNLLYRYVDLLAPTQLPNVADERGGPPSVRTWIIVLLCLVLFLFAALTKSAFKDDFQWRASFLLAINISVRLYYPSAYYPATASARGWIAHPITARIIAFCAEFQLYELWARWIKCDFWGNSNYLWLIVLFGEMVSTFGVFLQSEMLLSLEDTIWGMHTAYMAYLTYNSSDFPGFLGFRFSFFALFALYFLVYHLPKRYGIMFRRKNGGEELNRSLLSGSLLWGIGEGVVKIEPCHIDERAWVVPMMLGQSILSAAMYVMISISSASTVGTGNSTSSGINTMHREF